MSGVRAIFIVLSAPVGRSIHILHRGCTRYIDWREIRRLEYLVQEVNVYVLARPARGKTRFVRGTVGRAERREAVSFDERRWGGPAEAGDIEPIGGRVCPIPPGGGPRFIQVIDPRGYKAHQ